MAKGKPTSLVDRDELARRIRVRPGERVRLADRDTDWAFSPDLRDLGETVVKERALAALDQNRKALAKAQELLFAADSHALLLVFQAMDAAGKDGTIKHVMAGVNPQGCQVFSFKVPSEEELDHTFLWRCMKALPERGRIGIFNRSYYEEVLVVKVHPEFLDRQRLPGGGRGAKLWRKRYDDINAFERHLTRNGTVVLKFFLHVSRDEQRKRFLARLDDPDRHWKFSPRDVAERALWDDYMAAYEDMLSETTTKWAPWHVIPADQKWAARALVAGIVVDTINDLDLAFPKPTAEQQQGLAEARRALEAEGG